MINTYCLICKKAILPYSEYQAKGYEILRELQNDDLALNETYWAHIFIDSKSRRQTRKYLLLITNKYIQNAQISRIIVKR